MAIKVGGTTVIDDSRNVSNIGTIKGLTYPSSDGTTGQFLKTDGAGSLSFATVETDPTIATLTKSFAAGETSSISLSTAITTAPVVSVIKEVPQNGVTSKGSWDVNSTASNYELHDTSYDTTLTPGTVGYNTSLTADTNKDYYSNITNERGVRFKSDGTVMYIVDSTTNNLREYSLSTAYDPSTATLTNTIDNYLGTTTVAGFHFKPDGTKLYFVTPDNDTVHQYNLSTAWDVNSTHQTYPDATYTFDNAPASPFGLQFSTDGTKMFTNPLGNDAIYQYTLSTAWDVTTASSSGTFSYSSQSNAIVGFVFSEDGTKLFLGSDAATDVLYEYTLSTAWDVTTASYTGNTFTLGSGETSGLWFEDNGKKFYRVNSQNHTIHYFDAAALDIVSLGSGSFSSSDVGKTIKGNGGEVVLKTTSGEYFEVTAFTDSSTIASGSWTMTGLNAAGADDGLEVSNYLDNYNFLLATWGTSGTPAFSPTSQSTYGMGVQFKSDGTKMFIGDYISERVYQYTLSTPWNITTATYDNLYGSYTDGNNNGKFFLMSPDGTKVYKGGYVGEQIYQYTLSTPWDINTQTLDGGFTHGLSSSQHDGVFSSDGTYLYTVGQVAGTVTQWTCSTPYDITGITGSTATKVLSGLVGSTNLNGIEFNTDGTEMYVVSSAGIELAIYSLSTPWDITTASSTPTNYTTDIGTVFHITIGDSGTKFYMRQYNGSVYQFDIGQMVVPTSGYHIATTNAGGQIDTTTWLDINTMTADEAAGAGSVYYAVSTDDRTTWSVIKDSDGVRPIVRDNSGTWQYNNASNLVNNWDLSAAVYSHSFSVSGQETTPEGIFFKPDGTKMFICGIVGDDVNEYSLGTPWDVTTATFIQNFSVAAQSTNPVGIHFKPDGTKMFIMNRTSDQVLEYTLSTAWDVSSASYTQLFYVGGQVPVPEDLFFKSDGTKMYILDSNADNIEEYDLSTAWDISTASHLQTSPALAEGTPNGMFISPDGTKLFVTGQAQQEIDEWNLSTAWDISSAVYVQKLDTNTEDLYNSGVFFKEDGTVMYILGTQNDNIYVYNVGSSSYTTSTTWVDATTNDEFSALQEALTSNQFNRMNKTQLDAVTDPNHYTLGDSLDLMIAMTLSTSSANVPTSDGVAINYDAEALNQGAVLGTDYDFDLPNSTTLRVTSNAAQNLKIRVL